MNLSFNFWACFVGWIVWDDVIRYYKSIKGNFNKSFVLTSVFIIFSNILVNLVNDKNYQLNYCITSYFGCLISCFYAAHICKLGKPVSILPLIVYICCTLVLGYNLIFANGIHFLGGI